jgi:hypothetical protein
MSRNEGSTYGNVTATININDKLFAVGFGRFMLVDR